MRAQTNLQGPGNPETHHQNLPEQAKSESRETVHTKSNSLWPQWSTQLSPKAAAMTVTHVCLQGSDAMLCGEWERGGRWGVCKWTKSDLNSSECSCSGFHSPDTSSGDYLNGDAYFPSVSAPQSHSRVGLKTPTVYSPLKCRPSFLLPEAETSQLILAISLSSGLEPSFTPLMLMGLD